MSTTFDYATFEKQDRERPIEQVSDDPYIQAYYEVLREDGEGHNYADMLAHRKFPAIRTDATHFKGQWHKDQFNGDQYGRMARKIAERQGVSTKGRVYYHSLARYPGDPEAWIDSRGDIKRICEKRGWGCKGAVNVTREDKDVAPREKYEIADSLVEGYMYRAADEAQDPGLIDTPAKRQKLRDDIRTKLTPKNL